MDKFDPIEILQEEESSSPISSEGDQEAPVYVSPNDFTPSLNEESRILSQDQIIVLAK